MNRDTRKAGYSLATIEQAGLSEYPGLAALAYIPATSISARIPVALKAQRSLIIRLLVRRPLRSRNICDMKIDRNLRCANGRWTIEFRVEERALDQVRGQPDVYRVSFPPDLGPQLEEFLAIWRPLLPGADLPELFTTRAGYPFVTPALNHEVSKAILKRTSGVINLSQIRQMWATEFLTRTQDYAAAAVMLGDPVETVLRRYAYLRHADTSTLADKFFAQQVSGRFESRLEHSQKASRHRTAR